MIDIKAAIYKQTPLDTVLCFVDVAKMLQN